MRFVDDDQAERCVRQEQSRARADRHLGLAAGNRAPGAAALRRAKARMPGDGGAAEARLEALEERLGQRDFGQQDERLLVVAQGLGDRFEIDFGLARSGDAVEQHRVEAGPDRRGERLGRFALLGVELGRGEIGVWAVERTIGVDRHGLERAGIDEAAQHGVADLRDVGQLAHGALAAGQRGERFFTLRCQAIRGVAGGAIFGQLARAVERARQKARSCAGSRPAGSDNNPRSIRRAGAAARRSAATSSAAISGRRRLSPTSSLRSRSASHATPSIWRGPEWRDDDGAGFDVHAVGHAIIERTECRVQRDDAGAGEGHASLRRMTCPPCHRHGSARHFPRFFRCWSKSRTALSSSPWSRPRRRATS